MFHFFKPILKKYLKTIPSDLYRVWKSSQLSVTQKKITEALTFFKAKSTVPSQGILLMQMVEDYEFTIRMAAASKVLAEKNNLEVAFYDVEINWIYEKNFQKPFGSSLADPVLVKIHKALGGNVLFENSQKFHDTQFIQNKLDIIVNKLKTNGVFSLLDLELENIVVGDLVYDTYLRFCHQPTITEVNEDLIHIINTSLHLFYSFDEFVHKNNIKILLNTYSSYNKHGIPARICLHRNIDVFTIGSYSYVIQKLSKENPYHSFDNTSIKPEKAISQKHLEAAKEKFTSRFSGKIDAAVSYMRQSAFSNTPVNPEVETLFKKRTRNVVIYVHDFFDSPHVNRKLQFPDLYQFLRQTLHELTALEDTSVFIKAHPNGISGCKEITIEMVEAFQCPHFYLLDVSVSNLQIVSLRPDLICTARGTVGPEMAYFEIPTVALFDNMYANFKFVHTCQDLKTYFDILKGKQKPEIDFNKEMIYSFYYQAYMEKYPPEYSELLSLLAQFKGDTYNDRYLNFVLENKSAIFSQRMMEMHKPYIA